MSDETKKLFVELFDEDVSPSSAYRRVLDHFESNDDICADRFYVPDYKWVFNFHAKYIKNKFGSSNGVDILNKLKENITKYNEERSEELAKVQKDDRPILFNLFKNVLYSKTTQEFNRSVKIMKKNIIYRKYENFENHIEAEVLPRHAEWSMRERFEKNYQHTIRIHQTMLNIHSG